jgi:hypothetical protein
VDKKVSVAKFLAQRVSTAFVDHGAIIFPFETRKNTSN